jgi:diguanylate cyclase (GGDEF)-like protein
MIRYVQGSVEVARLSAALRSLLRRIDVTQEQMAAVQQRAAEETRRLSEDIDALKEIADTDPLTGLPNRRGMLRFGEDVMSAYGREERNFAVFVIDIDHFKRINDTHGHAVGDEAIRHVARIVQSAIRPSDRVARFGGEEFVVVLRDVSPALAGEIAERIRASIERSALMIRRTSISVTVSIGVALVAADDRDIQDVTERADMALYAAKSGGRNRVSVVLTPASERAA